MGTGRRELREDYWAGFTAEDREICRGCYAGKRKEEEEEREMGGMHCGVVVKDGMREGLWGKEERRRVWGL